MIESGLWSSVRRKLEPFGTLARVENKVDVGTPDVLYVLRGVTGLLELKSEPSYPKRGRTPLVVKKLTKAQVLWQEEWAKSGGRVRTLLMIGNTYTEKRYHAMLTPWHLRRVYERAYTLKDALEASEMNPFEPLSARELLRCLA